MTHNTPTTKAPSQDSAAPRNTPTEIISSVAILAAIVLILRASLSFLKNPDGPSNLFASFYDLVGAGGSAEAIRASGLSPITNKLIIAVVAIAVGIAGVWALFIAANRVIDLFSPRWAERLRPFLFVGPAVALLGFFLVYPAINTISTSITDDGGAIENYKFALTDPDMLVAFRNNILWLVLGTGGSVLIGLIIAQLVDRVKREALAKTFIFLPMAISMVGASVVWGFVYEWKPPGQPQIGVLNAGLDAVGRDPIAWLQTAPLNTLALIVIMVWLQTGFAMVILSAAIKGVPGEILEAARIDGANEFQIFRRVIVPSIKGSVITVATTIFVAILKVFDIVFVTTGGKFDTEVIANRMFAEMFKFRNFGRASALAVVLLVVVTPIMVLNVRNLRRQGIGA
ncbi:MAG: sugar ABC transporter permease [bacterium]|nr:sugar ABC transporter permease [bacterium]MCP4967674.1 sugar ABC transporter permease [bacterium]